MIGRSLIASVLSALVIGFAVPAAAAVPAGAGDASGSTAAADSNPEARADKGKAKGKNKDKDKDKALEKRFPMKAEEFKRRTEARLARAREKFAGMLDKHNVTEEQRDRALARFDEGAKTVRAAADQAGKDGTVTLDEAKHVRDVAKAERKEMKEELADARKDKKGKGKGKGKNKKA